MRNQRGFGLLWAMLLIIAVGSMTSVVLTRDRTAEQHARVDGRSLAAFHAAEGGLALARHALAGDAAFAGTTLSVGDCTVTVRVTRAGGSSWHIVSEAVPGAVRIEADLAPAAGLPAIRSWRQTR